MTWNGMPYTGTRDDKEKRRTLALRIQAPRGVADKAAEKRREKAYDNGLISPTPKDKVGNVSYAPDKVYSDKDTIISAEGAMRSHADKLARHMTLAGHYRHMSAGLAGDGYDPLEPSREPARAQCRKVYGYSPRPNSPFKRAAKAASVVVVEKKGKGGK